MATVTSYFNKRKIINTNKEHTFLSDLSSTADDWKIKVRVSRIWDTLNIYRNKELISTDMVLIDEKSNYMHATIGRSLASRFKNILKEGKIYTITNFMVTKNKEKFPVVEKNALMLQFDSTTIVKEIANGDNLIPHHIFEFVNFEDLPNQYDKDVLTDVIGVITNIGPVEEKTTPQGRVDTVTLHLKDIRGNNARVTIWDDYVTLFQQKMKESGSNASEPKVVILTSTRVKEFRGEISISTSRSTKIYVNIDIPEANKLIQSFKDSDEFHKVATSDITKSPMLDMDKKKTISEILEIATSKSDMNDTYCCAATINDILLKNGWFYASCPHCKRKVSNTSTKFSCDFCHKNVDYPTTRFRLELDVRDATNSTIFVVFDDIAEQIARVKLHDLLSAFEQGDNGDLNLPPHLLKIIGSSHVFQIKMSTYFESYGRQSFTANKLLKPVVKIEKEAEKEATEVNLPDKATEAKLEISDSSIGSPDINMSDSPQKRRKLRLQREGKKPNYPEKEEEEEEENFEDLDSLRK